MAGIVRDAMVDVNDTKGFVLERKVQYHGVYGG